MMQAHDGEQNAAEQWVKKHLGCDRQRCCVYKKVSPQVTCSSDSSEGSCVDVAGTGNALNEDVTPSCDKNLRYIEWNVGCQDEIHPLRHQHWQENHDLIYLVTATTEAGSRSQQKK